jgi:L-asparaginase II
VPLSFTSAEQDSMSRVEVWRGSVIESVHRVSIAVADPSGRLRAESGTPDLVCHARSAVKPLQALPLVEEGIAKSLSMTVQEIALCCASHSGESHHVATARAMLRRIGLDESALACGAHPPFHEPSARALQERGEKPGRIHNNCSGKHAGMLMLACAKGWPVGGYEKGAHAVQARMLDTIAAWTEAPKDEIPTAIDGCGVVTFALSLRQMASAFARFAAAARRGDDAPATIAQAMGRNPDYVGGTDRLCTELMRTVDGRIVVKTGAEGVYCATVPGAELGIALKVEDGAKRASEPALIAVLKALGLVSEDEVARLARFAMPVIVNTRGEEVGAIRARITLDAA